MTQLPEPQGRAGSPKDRAPKVATTAAYSLLGTALLGTADWLSDGWTKGGFELLPPSKTLVEVWAMCSLPTIHLISKVINRILTHWAGEDE